MTKTISAAQLARDTNLKLFCFANGEYQSSASGVLIAPRMALTAAHVFGGDLLQKGTNPETAEGLTRERCKYGLYSAVNPREKGDGVYTKVSDVVMNPGADVAVILLEDEIERQQYAALASDGEMKGRERLVTPNNVVNFSHKDDQGMLYCEQDMLREAKSLCVMLAKAAAPENLTEHQASQPINSKAYNIFSLLGQPGTSGSAIFSQRRKSIVSLLLGFAVVATDNGQNAIAIRGNSVQAIRAEVERAAERWSLPNPCAL